MAVRLLADMTDAEVDANTRIANCDEPFHEYIARFYEGLGMEVPVVWEPGSLRSLAGCGFSLKTSATQAAERALRTGALLVDAAH